MTATAAPLFEDLLEKEWDHILFGSQKGLAPMLGWKLCYHTLRSKGSQSGFPDRVLVRDRIIFAELKREHGNPTETQREWLNALAAVGAEVYLWCPSDLDEIATILGKRWTHEKSVDGRPLLRTEFASVAPGSAWLPVGCRADQLAHAPP